MALSENMIGQTNLIIVYFKRQVDAIRQACGVIKLEVLAIVKMGFLVKVDMNRRLDRRDFLERSSAPEFCDCAFASAKTLMRFFISIL